MVEDFNSNQNLPLHRVQPDSKAAILVLVETAVARFSTYRVLYRLKYPRNKPRSIGDEFSRSNVSGLSV